MPAVLLATFLLLGAPTDTLEASSRAGEVQPLGAYAPMLTDLLQQVVTADGLVRYDLLHGPLNTDFRRVLKTIETFDAERLTTDAEKLAFWMNAYNVQMLQHIVENPHVQNIIDDGYAEAFFQTPLLTAGRALSLDQIEHVILRRQDGPAALQALLVDSLDPRIHVGLNCAAVSCPRLRRKAFTPASVDEELDAAMRDFTNSLVHFRVEGETIVLSSLLDWFGADFDRLGKTAGDAILAYMNPARPNYTQLKESLSGRTAADLKALPNVRYAYRWDVNRVR
jgi:hypothetical protein